MDQISIISDKLRVAREWFGNRPMNTAKAVWSLYR